MSMRAHCDGPECPVVVPEGHGGPDWWAIAPPNSHVVNFHSRRCMERWLSKSMLAEPAPEPTHEADRVFLTLQDGGSVIVVPTDVATPAGDCGTGCC